jgi:hypothetical protein
MDLLDRYLGAIAALLPAGQSQDIVAELRDVLMSRIEDQENRLGRPLDKTAMEVLLRDFGHPLAVAGRYGPQRALIGVELYPFWIFAVKVALAIAAFVALIPAVIGVVTQGGEVGQVIGHALKGFIPSALTLIGLITVIGAMVERGWIKAGDFGQWKVSDLPRVSAKKAWFPPKSRYEALFEVVFMTLFALWWAGLLHWPDGRDLLRLDGDLQLALVPILTQLHVPILLLAIGQALSGLIVVVRPAWIAPRAVAEIALSIAGIALAAALWRAMPLVTFSGPALAAHGVETLQRTVDQVFVICALVAAALCAGKILIEGWRLARLGGRKA